MECLDALVICSQDFFRPLFIIDLFHLAMRAGFPNLFLAVDFLLDEVPIFFECDDEAATFPF